MIYDQGVEIVVEERRFQQPFKIKFFIDKRLNLESCTITYKKRLKIKTSVNKFDSILIPKMKELTDPKTFTKKKIKQNPTRYKHNEIINAILLLIITLHLL